MDITLPKEMWYKIRSDLDFDTLQKICVSLCQGWFENIRGNGRLSSQLSLKNGGRRGKSHFIKMEKVENSTAVQKFGPS